MRSNIDISATIHWPLLSEIDFSKAGYSVLVRNGQPLLLLPPEKRAAALTLDLYLPQGRKAKAAVAVLKTANKLGLFQRILPKLVSEHSQRHEAETTDQNSATTPPEQFHEVSCVSWLDSSAQSEPMPFSQDDIDRGRVGFLLCNPDHECARVVAVKAGNPASVIKWSDLSGEGKLNREIENIKALTEKHLQGLPALLSSGRNSTSLWFEMAHYAKVDVVSACDSRVIKLLEFWMSEETVNPLKTDLGRELWGSEEWTPQQECLERLGELKIRRAVMHGDFVPWNFRQGAEELLAIDWEWAREDGLAGIDLCYGLLQEALLVKEMPLRRRGGDGARGVNG